MDEPFFVSVLSSTPIRRTHTNTHNVNTKNTMEICISNQNQYINLTSICVALGIEALFASAFIHIESPARTWTPSKSQMMTESMCKQTPANNVSKLNENNVFSFNKMVIFYVCIVATSIVPSLCHIFLFHLSLSLSISHSARACVAKPFLHQNTFLNIPPTPNSAQRSMLTLTLPRCAASIQFIRRTNFGFGMYYWCKLQESRKQKNKK